MANYYPHQAEDTRYRALSEGDQISSRLSDEELAQQQQAQQYQQQENAAWGPNGENSRGYNPDQAAAIMGDPNAQLSETLGDNARLHQAVDVGNGNENFTAGAAGNNIQSAVNPGAATGPMAATFAAATDRSKLGLSDQFNQNYKFTPEDEQNMITSAGQTVGNRYAALQDADTRAALASGESPAGLAVARLRAANAGSADADQAMLAAKVAAKQMGLNTTQTAEQMRLGAEQGISDRLIGTGTTLGQTTLQGQQMKSGAAATAGQLETQAQKDAADRMAQQGEFATTTNQAARQYTDMQGSQRAATVANNQQQQQQQYRDYLTNSKNTSLQAGATGNQQQISNLGTKLGVANQSTQIAAGNNQPSLWSKIGGAALQLGSTALGAWAGA